MAENVIRAGTIGRGVASGPADGRMLADSKNRGRLASGCARG